MKMLVSIGASIAIGGAIICFFTWVDRSWVTLSGGTAMVVGFFMATIGRLFAENS